MADRLHDRAATRDFLTPGATSATTACYPRASASIAKGTMRAGEIRIVLNGAYTETQDSSAAEAERAREIAELREHAPEVFEPHTPSEAYTVARWRMVNRVIDPATGHVPNMAQLRSYGV